jgi:glycosyltransferase involved in cell wall biosynthesis
MRKLNLLILNGDLPVFPGWGGIEYLHTTHLTRWANKVGLVSMAHTREQLEKTQALVEAGVALYLWQSPHLDRPLEARNGHAPSFARRVGKSVYRSIHTGWSRPQDTLLQDFQFTNLAQALLRALADEAWHVLLVVQSHSALWSSYMPRLPVQVLMMHDVCARVYERKARAAASPLQRARWLLEAARYRRFERERCRDYDLVVTVSDADAAYVQRQYRPARLATIPIPVDADYFARLPYLRGLPDRILFTGNMNHPPNIDAADFFARQVLPHVQAQRPRAEFWIVGREPAAEVKALRGIPGVVVTGVVSDIRPFIASASAYVVPLRFGSGMRQKILEAWALEKGIVSTSIGAEGLDHSDGRDIFIADDAHTFASRVIDVLSNHETRQDAGARGRELVCVQHRPDALSRKYYAAIVETAGRMREQPMHAAIDLRWMRPGVAGGIENLSRSFVDELIKLDRFNRYTLLVQSEVKYDFDLRARSNFEVSVINGPAYFRRRGLAHARRWLHRRLRKHDWRSHEVDVLRRARGLHAEVALSIPGYIHPDLHPLSNVLLMTDLQHEYMPDFFSEHEVAQRRRIYSDAARRARHICAISEFTRQTLIERLRIDPARVTTTHLAADPLFHAAGSARGNAPRILQKYQLPIGEYLFFPGNTWPHKNHRAALNALKILDAVYRLKPLLICTGSEKEAHSDIRYRIDALGLEDQVRFLGYCPAEDMPGLYEGAAAMVFPSLFEGFGIPLLEAMWCDCPIVCSNVTSLPEVAGDAALLIDPHSPEALADALACVLCDSDLRDRLIAAGRRRARAFSWRKFTMDVVRILHQVHALRAVTREENDE